MLEKFKSSLLLISGAMFLQNVDPVDLGTRGLTAEELASANLKSKRDWPECKFDKPMSTGNLELKGTKETGPKYATSYQIIKLMAF